MAVSTFDLFRIGIGPSSSHTVGPMVAARCFVQALASHGQIDACARLQVHLYGSLGATGAGHGTPGAVILGLEGESPERVDVAGIPARIQAVRGGAGLRLDGWHPVAFHFKDDLYFHRGETLPLHSNGMRFVALDARGERLREQVFYSVGGGFILEGTNPGGQGAELVADSTRLPHPFASAAELLALCREHGLPISQLMWANERAWRDDAGIRNGLLNLWEAMAACIERGCRQDGVLPGGLKVPRRAPGLHRQLLAGSSGQLPGDPGLISLDWVTLYALAVNEENAAGGRVVTAPTNGAAGIVPAVLKYALTHCGEVDREAVVCQFLLTAAAIGCLYKANASISGAEVGCQGEVGSACSMAAGALTEVLGGTPAQVENAAEIAMEHNLGLTCDPVGGLVQVPCIERNAMGAIKAISAARMALRGDGRHCVSLDQVIRTMRDTGRDMQDKYKETARGGLAVHVIEIPVSQIDC